MDTAASSLFHTVAPRTELSANVGIRPRADMDPYSPADPVCSSPRSTAYVKSVPTYPACTSPTATYHACVVNET
jgi:hypothetical protein